MRTLGYLGILALVPINILGFVSAFQKRNLGGLGLMLFMAALLAGFAFTLRRGAQIERGSIHQKLAEGWCGESVTSFFENVVAKSLEGRIFLAGAVANVLAAALAQLWPEAIGIPPSRAAVNAVLFGMWPIVSLVWYVKVCGPRYEPSIVKILFTLAASLFPFYVAYLRNAA